MITIQHHIDQIASDAMRILMQARRGFINEMDMDTLEKHVVISLTAMREHESAYNVFTKDET